MNLKKTIQRLRRRNTPLDRIYLFLAMVEVNGHKTPFFEVEDEEELVDMLSIYLGVHEATFTNKLLDDYDKEDFFGFLAHQKEFDFKADDLKEVYNAITKQGEEHYGFKRFDRMDEDDTKLENPPRTGPER